MSDSWAEAFYAAPLAAAILTCSDDELARSEAFLWSALELRAGLRVFDQCCGAGHLARRLHGRGCEVGGVDISAPFIAEAKRHAAEGMTFNCADARSFVAEPACDAGYNWGTGFGNFARDADNAAMLAAAQKSLRAGAWYLLDYFNVAGVLAGFRPTFSYTRPLDDRAVEITRRSRLDLVAGTMHQQWTLDDGTQRQQLPETTTRLYLPRELAAMLDAAGFSVEAIYGDHEGGALTLSSPRCVLRARRR